MILNKVDREDSTENVIFESRSVEGERGTRWISGEEQTRQREQQVQNSWGWFRRNSREASAAGAE